MERPGASRPSRIDAREFVFIKIIELEKSGCDGG